MTLTQPQQKKVEQNLGLVGKVIKDKVHNPGQNSIYSYDDLYQIGCIGLCKAAYSDKGGCFSTYAYRKSSFGYLIDLNSCSRSATISFPGKEHNVFQNCSRSL